MWPAENQVQHLLPSKQEQVLPDAPENWNYSKWWREKKKKEPIWGRGRGGRADERVEKDMEMDRQIEDDEERNRGGLTPSKITDRHGDLPASQSVSHIHSWPHYGALPQPDTDNGASVCVYVCVRTHRAINRYSGPTKETPPPLSDPCMSDTRAPNVSTTLPKRQQSDTGLLFFVTFNEV